MDSCRSAHLVYTVAIDIYLYVFPFFQQSPRFNYHWSGLGPVTPCLLLPPTPVWAKLDCVSRLMPRGGGYPIKVHAESKEGDAGYVSLGKNGGTVAQRSRNVCLAGDNIRYPICLPSGL